MIFFWELHVLYILKWIVILKWQELEDLCSMEDKHETLRKWWLFVLGILISLQIVIILAGNGVVLFTLNKYKFHLSLATKYFISSMAVADILLGVVHLPLVMVSHIGGNKVAEIQSVCIIRQASAIGIYSAILCNHFAVAVDRYIAILHPLRYHALMKIRNIVFVLIIIWTSSCFLTTLPVITDLTKGSHSRTDKILFCGSLREIWPLVDKHGILLFLVIIISIPVTLHIRIYLVARKQRRLLVTVCRSSMSPRRKASQKTAKVMALLQFLFIVFWVPFLATIPLHFTGISTDLKDIVVRTSVFVATCNSAFNPFVYFLLKKEFKFLLKNHLKNCCGRNSS